MIQESEKPYRTVKEKLSRGGHSFDNINYKFEMTTDKPWRNVNNTIDKPLHDSRIRKTLQFYKMISFTSIILIIYNIAVVYWQAMLNNSLCLLNIVTSKFFWNVCWIRNFVAYQYNLFNQCMNQGNVSKLI